MAYMGDFTLRVVSRRPMMRGSVEDFHNTACPPLANTVAIKSRIG